MRRTLLFVLSYILTLPAYSDKLLEPGLMDEVDLAAIVEEMQADPTKKEEVTTLLFFYRDFVNSPRYLEAQGQYQVEAMKVLMKPRYMTDVDARRKAASTINDPCLNEVGDIKPELVCQAAARAAYLRQALNLIYTH